MRSRYAAFALGLGDYLVRTLDEDHVDRVRDVGALARELRGTRERLKYMGLTILDHEESGASARVLFHARIFEKGVDRSFTELSAFRHDGSGWRYLDGRLVPTAHPPEALTIAAFLAADRSTTTRS